MKISLSNIKEFNISNSEITKVNTVDWISAEVLVCGVCRTDAKLWNEGHRELEMPRVPGHEMVVSYQSKKYSVWPGIICGECKYCKAGKTNLCENIKIIGFHSDGGFANKINVPFSCLVPLGENTDNISASFAEPAGCIINAFNKANLSEDENILIYGAGNLGLLTALIAKHYGANPLIIEKNQEKIDKARSFIAKTNIEITKSTNKSHFDVVINACADPIALMTAITKADKGARVVHFSGLNKNENLETNLLNLIHYKEITFMGSYGLTKENMIEAIRVLESINSDISFLVERIIQPAEVIEVIERVIKGTDYKYIIDFGRNEKSINKFTDEKKSQEIIYQSSERQYKIAIPDWDLKPKAQYKIDNKTKPLGALGVLEKLSVKMSLLQNTLNPIIRNKAMFVFAADHGIAEEGVSAFPQEVTRQMVQNFLDEGAAINVLSKHNNISLYVVDAGVKKDFDVSYKNFIDIKIAKGTENFALQQAMTYSQARQIINNSYNLFHEKNKEKKLDIIGLGEMGIANTTSATAIISAITGRTVTECTGRGTGVDNQGLEHKIKVIEKALRYHKPNPNDAIDIISKVGGYEIAAMTGMALAAAENGTAIVLDGLISTAAGLLAYIINPVISNYFVSGHKSVEKGHIFALEYIGISPVLDLSLRLGEGTGAALTINLVEAACKIMCEMASFDEAGVSISDV